jgi:ribonuclease HI
MNEEEVVIHTDGGSRGNPGPAACAFVAEIGGKIVAKDSIFLGRTTNNVAEYQGVVTALKWIKENNGSLKFTGSIFYLDSELVTRQLNGLYKIKNVKLIALFLLIKNLEKDINIKITYKHIPRNQNKIADFLVNKILDEKEGK